MGKSKTPDICDRKRKMRKRYKDRYGIQKNEVENLQGRWKRRIKDDSEWDNFDSFALWCSVSGYTKGRQIRKRDETKPHGPGNSFWYDMGVAKEEKRRIRIAAKQNRKSSFCAACDKKCPGRDSGCKAWHEWFVTNWDEKIHQEVTIPEPVAEPEPVGRQFFRYEHPDLIREGIANG